MQWLIDLIIEAIGIPPTYVDRGGVGPPDFVVGDFIRDSNWYDWDLSSIVPAGATAVAFSFGLETDAIEDCAHFKNNYPGGIQNRAWLNTQVANSLFTGDAIVGVDSDRKARYRFIIANWTVINITIKGWWL